MTPAVSTMANSTRSSRVTVGPPRNTDGSRSWGGLWVRTASIVRFVSSPKSGQEQPSVSTDEGIVVAVNGIDCPHSKARGRTVIRGTNRDEPTQSLCPNGPYITVEQGAPRGSKGVVAWHHL